MYLVINFSIFQYSVFPIIIYCCYYSLQGRGREVVIYLNRNRLYPVLILQVEEILSFRQHLHLLKSGRTFGFQQNLCKYKNTCSLWRLPWWCEWELSLGQYYFGYFQKRFCNLHVKRNWTPNSPQMCIWQPILKNCTTTTTTTTVQVKRNASTNWPI